MDHLAGVPQTDFEVLRKRYIAGFSAIADSYDVFIFDIFGTLCDGGMSVFQVQEALQKLKFQDKKVVFFSNMPRPGKIGLLRLEERGLMVPDFDCYTSADYFLDVFCLTEKPFFHLGQERNFDLFEKMPIGAIQEDNIENAQYVVLTAFSYGDHDPYHDHILSQLNIAYKNGAHLLCLNPDCTVALPASLCPPGYFANYYLKRGGEVTFYGKPYQSAYEWLLKQLSIEGYHDVKKMLMVGDNLSTDIEGGQSVGMDTAWVLSGILPEQKTPFVMPTYVLNSVKW